MITRKVLINKFVNFVTKGFELSQAINDEYKTIKKFKKDRNNAKEKKHCKVTKSPIMIFDSKYAFIG